MYSRKKMDYSSGRGYQRVWNLDDTFGGHRRDTGAFYKIFLRWDAELCADTARLDVQIYRRWISDHKGTGSFFKEKRENNRIHRRLKEAD